MKSKEKNEKIDNKDNSKKSIYMKKKIKNDKKNTSENIIRHNERAINAI